jgi:hypothetical protein
MNTATVTGMSFFAIRLSNTVGYPGARAVAVWNTITAAGLSARYCAGT